MNETIYPFNQEQIREMARLKKQADALNKTIPLPAQAREHTGQAYQVLDLACGPGSWAMSVAKQHPDWQVQGLDISNRMIDFAQIQSRADGIENVSFQVGNVLEHLPFADKSFDFIHARLLQCFMRIDAWSRLLAECHRVLKPGAFIQLVESERPIFNKPANAQFASLAAQMCTRLGVSGDPSGQVFGICNLLAQFLTDAGFLFEEERAYSINYSAQMPIHQIWCENVAAAIKQYPEIYAKQGKPTDEIEQLCEQAIQEMNEPDFCALFFFLSVVARKP